MLAHLKSRISDRWPCRSSVLWLDRGRERGCRRENTERLIVVVISMLSRRMLLMLSMWVVGVGHVDVDIEDSDEEDGEDLDVDIEALNPNAHCWLLSCNIGQLYVNPMTIMCLCDVYYLQDVWYVFLYFQDGWYKSIEISSPQNDAVKKNRNTKE